MGNSTSTKLISTGSHIKAGSEQYRNIHLTLLITELKCMVHLLHFDFVSFFTYICHCQNISAELDQEASSTRMKLSFK